MKKYYISYRFIVFSVSIILSTIDLFGQIRAQDLFRNLCQNCQKDIADYESSTYKVTDVSIKLNFVIPPLLIDTEILLKTAQQALLREQKKSINTSQAFTQAGYNNLFIQLNSDLEQIIFKRTGSKGILAIFPRVVNCNDSLRTIQVVYVCLALASSGQSYLTNVFELPGIYLNKKDTTLAFSDNRKTQLTPYLAFNESRGVVLGSSFSTWFKGKLINKLDVNANLSRSSAAVYVALGGSHQFGSRLLDFAEWKVGYQYSDITAKSLTLKESVLLAQFFAAARPISTGNITIRYGTSIEGGNKKTNLAQADLPMYNLAQSGYGSTKFYVGGNTNWGRQSFKLSYGLQLGNTGQDLQVNYLKHILDAAYRGKFLISEHKPLQIDAHFTAGMLKSVAGNVPVGERFFGGNAEKNFIQSNAWRIRSNPFIRSISQNLLNSSSNGKPIGGDGFQSINLTLSQPVWHKPVIPKEITQSLDITRLLDLGIRTQRKIITSFEAAKLSQTLPIDTLALQAYNTSDIIHLSAFLNDTLKIDQTLNSISEQIKSHRDFVEDKLKQLAPQDKTINNVFLEGRQKLDEVEYYIKKTVNNLPALEDSTDFDFNTEYSIEAIVIGNGDAVPAYLTGIYQGIKALKKTYALRNRLTDWAALNRTAQKLIADQKRVKKEIKDISVPLAEKAAKPTIGYVGQVLGVLFKELNIAAISPFFMLDAARLNVTENNARNNVRYGAGAGIRLSITNFDVYAGYSFNINRQASEGSGAFVFTIDITNIF